MNNSSRKKGDGDYNVLAARQRMVAKHLDKVLSHLQVGLQDPADAFPPQDLGGSSDAAGQTKEQPKHETCLVLDDEQLEQLDKKLEEYNAYHQVMDRRIKSDFLYGFLYNPGNVRWRYKILSFVQTLLLEWIEKTAAEHFVMANAHMSVLTQQERADIESIFMPLNWSEAPYDTWAQYETALASGDPVEWSPAQPHNHKLAEETILLLGVLTHTSVGESWIRSGNTVGGPRIANPSEQHEFLRIGRDDCSVAKAFCRIIGVYHTIVDGSIDPDSPYATEMDLMCPEPFHPNQLPPGDLFDA
jgi:hypothetical protein